MLQELADRAAIVDAVIAYATALDTRDWGRLGAPGGDKFLGGGRYDDRLRRTPGGWRFTHRSITSVWSEGNPAVITS